MVGCYGKKSKQRRLGFLALQLYTSATFFQKLKAKAMCLYGSMKYAANGKLNLFAERCELLASRHLRPALQKAGEFKASRHALERR